MTLLRKNELYSTIDMKLRVRLSYRDDGDGYLGDESLWKTAQEHQSGCYCK